MHIDELCQRFRMSRYLLRYLISRGIVPPARCTGRCTSPYGREHVEALAAYTALRHYNTSFVEVAALLKEDGITIVQYAKAREKAIRDHGLGVA